ncbi:MAG: DNA starvation/stationary phase protection protein Dps [Richelia sp. RM2_1_2]|nr:DNA starvation/stationary phase protection protein Dps [Richelia sp. SM1_7_0]NJN10947.1 DNA starvation/stationary phase protection protein Dps [Richelia sp. RM1_1_1]NJO29258.1 DNA starvation/stationary phase protection protein Dps [Richelia sp. SL_2_1]NJO61590.1 DNA starvation/stationary phase protection protein Dps [Richelia sp. RM2_1_2]NJS16139.1 DNA starvation/stationary phase protection protein Dps [Nostocaceae cyanobacterium CSU_2_110]
MSDSNGKLASRLYPSHIDIPADVRSQVVSILNQTLAATADLKSQVKQAHWNVKGTDFYQLHEMFDEIAGEIEEFIDMFAERITALAGYACGTVRMAAANSILPEYPTDILDGMQHVTALVERFAAYAKHLREAIDKTDELNEQDTNDLYVEVSRTIDKRLWFLEAHIQVSEVKSESATQQKTGVK